MRLKLNNNFLISGSITKFSKIRKYLYNDLNSILAEDSMEYYVKKKKEYNWFNPNKRKLHFYSKKLNRMIPIPGIYIPVY